MDAPAFVPERGEIWHADGNGGFSVLRVTNGVWPFVSAASASAAGASTGAATGGTTTNASVGAAAAAPTGTLPATGTSGVLVVVGLGLLVAAFEVRRAVASREVHSGHQS